MKPGTQPQGFTNIYADAYSTQQQSVEILYVASTSDLQLMRPDSMTENQLCYNVNYIWKDVRALNWSNVTVPCIEAVSGAKNMVELWRQTYSGFFNCVMNEPYIGNGLLYGALQLMKFIKQ